MFDTDPHPQIAQRVRMLQLIVAAMALGVLIFLVIVLVVPARGADQASDSGKVPIVSYIALAYGLAALPLGVVLPAVVAASGRRRIAAGTDARGAAADQPSGTDPIGKLLGLLVAKTIIGGAIHEGAALFLCVAYLLEHNRISALLAALLAATLLAQIPTRDRAQRWLDDQRRRLEQEAS